MAKLLSQIAKPLTALFKGQVRRERWTEDTFHEVKRKRDKRKEGSKEPSDSRLGPALQGRGGKTGRGNYSSRSLSSSNDSAGRIAISGKENGINHVMEKGRGSTLTINANMDVKASTSMASLSSDLPNGPQPVDPIAVVVTISSAAGDTIKSGSAASADLKGGLSSDDVVAGPNAPQPLRPASPSDFMAVPSLDSHGLGDDVAGASRQDIGSDKTSVELKACLDVPIAKKVIASKEWKPKPTRSTASQANKNVAIPNSVPVAADTIPHSSAISNSVGTEDLLKMDNSFNGLQLSDKQHVIIPDHLQVSESEKYSLSFGSFSASFQQTMGSSDPECTKSSLPEYNSSHELNDSDHEPQPVHRDQNSSSPVQGEADHVPRQLPSAKLENCALSAMEISSIAPTGSDECRDDSAASGVPQSTSVCTTPSYVAYGLAPQSHGNHIVVIDKSESQVPAPIDFSTSYSTQWYQPAANADERLSPFLAAEPAHKYGNILVIPAQTGQDQEVNNSLVIASSVSASAATPGSGVLPTSVAIPQQSVPVFRQPLGVHIPHFPTNYVPYNQYISPFFIPLPALHPFMSNATFPQPPSTGAMYPAPGSAGILPPVKYSLPPFKPGPNTGSQASIGIPGGYGTFDSSPSVYTNNATVLSGNVAENDDVTSSQFKENSIYIAGLQTEGSALWIPMPGRDISALQANSFYGLAPQGQQVTFAPQAGPFGGIYHPAHTVAGAAVHPLLQPSHTMAGAIEIVGAPDSVYQHPQAQMNWGSY